MPPSEKPASAKRRRRVREEFCGERRRRSRRRSCRRRSPSCRGRRRSGPAESSPNDGREDALVAERAWQQKQRRVLASIWAVSIGRRASATSLTMHDVRAGGTGANGSAHGPCREKTLAKSEYVCKINFVCGVLNERDCPVERHRTAMTHHAFAAQRPRHLHQGALAGPVSDNAPVEALVAEVIENVRKRGDAAVREYSKAFDKVEIEALRGHGRGARGGAAPNSIRRPAPTRSSPSPTSRAFAEAQLATILPLEIETLPGLHLGHRVIPIERVGCYVPGGRYPLLSAPIMTIVPAKVAGCEEVIACLPPNAHPAMIAGCHLSGADRIFRIGGAQAIAAMAYGTETVPAVDKIVGPGNAFVNEAKRQVFGPVGIDQLAGPSEIFVVADRHRRCRDDRDRPAGAGRARRAHPRGPDHHRPGAGRGDARRGRAPARRRCRPPNVAGTAWRGLWRDRPVRRRGDDDRLFRLHRRRAPAGAHRRSAGDGQETAQLRLAVHRRARQRGLFGQVLRHQPHAPDHGRRRATRAASGSAPT